MGNYRELSDQNLATLLIGKDRAAFEEIYLRYFNKLFDFARRLLRDNAAAEDLIHDLYAHLIDPTTTLNIDGPLDAYLYRAARNRIINSFHKDKNRQKHIEGLKALFEKGVFATDELILEREMKRRIDDTVASFPPKMRETFEMSRKAHLSRKKIAEATGTSESTVNSQINKALNILRSKLTIWFF